MLTLVTDATEKMEPPVFVVKPVNKDVKEEGKATFECKLKGKPLPEVTWSVVSYLAMTCNNNSWQTVFSYLCM